MPRRRRPRPTRPPPRQRQAGLVRACDWPSCWSTPLIFAMSRYAFGTARGRCTRFCWAGAGRWCCMRCRGVCWALAAATPRRVVQREREACSAAKTDHEAAPRVQQGQQAAAYCRVVAYHPGGAAHPVHVHARQTLRAAGGVFGADRLFTWSASSTWGGTDTVRRQNRLAAHGWQGVALVLVGIVVGLPGPAPCWPTRCACTTFTSTRRAHRSGADQRTSILITAIAGLVGTFYFYAVNKSAYLEGKMAEARMHASRVAPEAAGDAAGTPCCSTPVPACACSSAPTRPGAAHAGPHDCLPAAPRSRIAQHQHPLAWSLSACATIWSLMAVRMGPCAWPTLDLPDALRDVAG